MLLMPFSFHSPFFSLGSKRSLRLDSDHRKSDGKDEWEKIKENENEYELSKWISLYFICIHDLYDKPNNNIWDPFMFSLVFFPRFKWSISVKCSKFEVINKAAKYEVVGSILIHNFKRCKSLLQLRCKA